MSSHHRRTGSFAIALALLLALSAVGPAAAETTVKRIWSAEKYALSLLNCTRTGGWVTVDGQCTDRASGEHSAWLKPLPLHKGLSKQVAWPWARAMANHNVCAHSIPGKRELRSRFTSKGFSYGYYGENIGCGWGHTDAKKVVLMTHRAFQKEKAENGGHWRNIKDAGYKSVGIGVAKKGKRIMVVYDFYGKRW